MKSSLVAISRRARPPRLKPVLLDCHVHRQVPDGASCSRWFSCTCCSAAKRRPEGVKPAVKISWSAFLKKRQAKETAREAATSSSPLAHAEAPPRQPVEQVPLPPPAIPRVPPRPLPSTPISPFRWTRSLSGSAGAHLMLPPPLPYSPDSIPFKRHQQALSFALSSPDPDESWAVYQALHDDLKRHVSDELYCSLVRHQLEGVQDEHTQDLETFFSSFSVFGAPTPEARRQSSGSRPNRRLQRVQELLSFARKCQMPFDRFNLQTLLDLVSIDFRQLDLPPGDLGSLLLEIWDSLRRKLHGDLSSVSPALRRRWIEMLLPPDRVNLRPPRMTDEEKAQRQLFHTRISKKQRDDRKHETRILTWRERSKRRSHFTATLEALKFLTAHRGARSLDQIIHRFLVMSTGRDPASIVRSLGRLADLAELEPSIPSFRIVQSLIARLTRFERRVVFAYLGAIDERINRIASSSAAMGEAVRETWDKLRIRLLPLHEQVEHLARDTTQSKAKLTQVGIQSLYHAALSDQNVDRAMDGALALLWTIVWDKRQESGSLTRAIIHHLSLAPGSDIYVPRVQRLVDILIEADTLNRLAPSSFAQLFTLCLKSGHRRLLSLALDLYTWDLKPPRDPKWMDWRRLSPEYFSAFLHFLLGLERRNVVLASRLYTDYISFGLFPPTADALMLVKAISRTPNQSRNLLLERHVKDYLFLNLGPREDLIKTLIEGLLESYEPDDAWLAFRVANRINRGRVLGLTLVDPIVDVMLLDTSLPSVARCATICRRMTDPRPYYTRLMKIISTEMEGTMEFTESRRRLALANHFYTDMVRRHLVPPSEFLSLLVREMAQAGETDLALGNFEKCLEKRIEMDDRVAATLIVRLAMKSQFDTAEQVEQSWIQQSGQESWEKSEKMQGARAYLDTKRGIDVREDGLKEWVIAAKGWTDGVGGPMIEEPISGIIGSASDVSEEESREESSSISEKSQEDQWEVVTQKVWKAGSGVDEGHSPWSQHGNAPLGLVFN